jgi:hypothetical protein
VPDAPIAGETPQQATLRSIAAANGNQSSNSGVDFDSPAGKLAILNGSARVQPSAPKAPPPANDDAPPPKQTGAIPNLLAGANSAITGLLGAPVDLVSAALRGTPPGINFPSPPADYAQRHPQAAAFLNTFSGNQPPIGGSDSLNSALGTIGADPRNVVPTNSLERFTRAAGSGAASMLAPVGGLPRSVTDLIRLLGIGAASGGSGELAAQAAPDNLKPLARTAGELAGGGVAALADTGVAAATRGATDAIKNFAKPFTQSGRQDIAAQRLAAAASNPGGVADTLANDANASLVPGSNPTTGQLTGDPGLLAQERVAATKNPDFFNARRSQQQEAQVAALGNVQAGGDPSAFGNFVRDQLDALDSRNAQTVADAQRTALDSNSALGGFGAPQGYGASIRDSLAAARQSARDNESQLWQAIDPDKRLAIDVSPAKGAADDIASGVGQYARAPEGEEAAILGKMRMAPQTMPFSDLTDLRGRLLAAIRDERFSNGNTPALARMQQLRQAMDDTIATGAQRVAEQEQQAVASGTMAPQDTLEARLRTETAAWQNGARGAVAEGSTGRSVGASPTGFARGGSRAVPGSLGTEGQAGGRLGISPGNPGVQSSSSGEQALTPNFDADAAQRYRAAADATRNRVDTFGTGATGNVLRSGATGGSYRLPDSAVAARFFNKGKTSAEDVQSFLRASGSRPDAVDALQDYAAMDLRRASSRPDGSLDPRKIGTWLDQHQDALQSFPELRQRFANAGQAEQSVLDAEANRNAALKAKQRYSAQRFIGADPARAFGDALASRDPAGEMGKLARWASLDRTGEATEGLRRAAVEHMQQRFLTDASGNTSIKAQAFQTFLAKNHEALSTVFPPERMQALDSIAADLQRTNPVRGKLAASPGTAQDLTGVARHAAASGEGHGDNLLSYLVALGLEHHTGNLMTSLGGAIGIKAANALRAHGLQKADDMLTEALLNPRLARTLLARVTPQNRASITDRLTRQLTTLSAASAAQYAEPQ